MIENELRQILARQTLIRVPKEVDLFRAMVAYFLDRSWHIEKSDCLFQFSWLCFHNVLYKQVELFIDSHNCYYYISVLWTSLHISKAFRSWRSLLPANSWCKSCPEMGTNFKYCMPLVYQYKYTKLKISKFSNYLIMILISTKARKPFPFYLSSTFSRK